METKKSDRANLEKKRSMFFQVGLLLALGLAFVAFEWQVAPRISDIVWDPIPFTDGGEIVVARTFPETPPPPAPPQSSMDLEIVSDEVIIDHNPVFDWGDQENIMPEDLFAPIAMKDDDEDIIFTPVEASALFKGKPAEEGFREYMASNLKYPQIAIENNIYGKVYVQFVVDQKGNVIDVEVIRGVDPVLDNEAARLIRSSSGMWTPGKQREKPVKVRYTFPITFKLQ